MKILKLMTYRHFWLDLFYNIECFFKPKQKWLTKTIPNTWKDKTELIRDILFECVVHYVERENHDFDYNWSPELEKGYISQELVDKMKEFDSEIMECYKYIKNERTKFLKQIDDLYGKTDVNFDKMFKKSDEHPGYYELVKDEANDAIYKQINKIELEMEARDQQILHLIINNRQKLWT